MLYDVVQTTRADLREHNLSRIVLSPKQWVSYKSTIPLSWSVVKFDESEKEQVPDDRQGVYTFVVKPGIANHPECAYLLYVGKTEKQGFRKRFTQYFSEKNDPKGREPVKMMLGLWKEHLWFCYAPIDDIQQIDSIEKSLIDAFVPPINQEYRGTLGKAMRAWR